MQAFVRPMLGSNDAMLWILPIPPIIPIPCGRVDRRDRKLIGRIERARHQKTAAFAHREFEVTQPEMVVLTGGASGTQQTFTPPPQSPLASAIRSPA